MTTRIHVVNLGPDVVEARTQAASGFAPVKLYPQESANFYVYDSQEVTVRELKPEAPKS